MGLGRVIMLSVNEAGIHGDRGDCTQSLSNEFGLIVTSITAAAPRKRYWHETIDTLKETLGLHRSSCPLTHPTANLRLIIEFQGMDEMGCGLTTMVGSEGSDMLHRRSGVPTIKAVKYGVFIVETGNFEHTFGAYEMFSHSETATASGTITREEEISKRKK